MKSRLTIINLGLRLASLAGKFLLSLYLAKFLSLADLGLYGLIVAIQMIAVVLFGFRADHVLARRLSTASPDQAGGLLRDQSLFFGANYLAVTPILLIPLLFDLSDAAISALLFGWVICVSESYANLLFVNTNALGRSAASNAIFFVRAGLWAFVAIAVGVIWPSMRHLDVVLGLWTAGSLLSIVLNLIILKAGRWPSFAQRPFDRDLIASAVKGSALIWVGALGLIGGSYIDRFILAAYLSLGDVGVATFYTSFSTSVLTLITSSTLAVASPKLIQSADGRDWPAFRSELRHAGRAAAILSLILCAGIVVVMPFIGRLLGKAELSGFSLALLLIMAATWIRTIAETAFAGLYALHDDRSIWLGNLLYLIPATLLNLALIPFFGLAGLGVSSLISSLLLLWWRKRNLGSALKVVRTIDA